VQPIVSIASALLLLLVSACISLWAAYDPGLSLPTVLTLLVCVSLFFVITQANISSRLIGKGLVLVGGLIAFYFVGQYTHLDYWAETGRLARLGRLTGSFLPNLVFFTPHPNAIATFSAGVFCLSLVLAWQSRGPERIGWGLAVVVVAYSLLISASRGAWFGLGVALSLWLLMLLPNRSLRLLLGGVIGLSLGAGFYLLLNLAQSGQSPPLVSSALNTFTSRFILYRNSFYLSGDYPFTGIGLGDTFAMVYSRYQLLIPVPFLFYTHNIFLAVALGQGILGLIALAWLLIGFYHFVIQVEGVGLPEPQRWRFRAAWLGVTATFSHGLIDASQFSGDYWTMPLLFALLGLAVAIGRPVLRLSRGRERTRPGQQMRRAPYGKPATIIAAGLVVGLLVFWQPLLSAWYANLGSVYQTWADLAPELDEVQRETTRTAALSFFERSLQLDPEQPVANRRLGLIALEQQRFESARDYLERAYSHEPGNQATLKALGYAYLWTGQLTPAQALLRQLDDQGELIEELGNWQNWWASQNRVKLSRYAAQMRTLLVE
jgi:tetratricopeptide (TPR) repeat protein